MADLHKADVSCLLNAVVRERMEIAVAPGLLDGDPWLASSVDAIKADPDSYRWVRVDSAVENGDTVVVVAAGHRFEQFDRFPIVLREVAPS